MSAVLVQKKSAVGSSASPGVTLDGNPTLGNLLVGVVGGLVAPTNTSPASSFANAVEQGNNAGNRTITIGYKVVDTAQAATPSVQPTTQSNAGWNCSVMEFSEMVSSSILDKVNSLGPAGLVNSTQTGDTGILSQANEVAVAAAVMSGSLTGEAIDSGFTIVDPDILDFVIVGYKITTVTTTLNPTLSWTGSTRNRAAGIATFKQASSTGRLQLRSGGAFASKTIQRRESGLWVTKTFQIRQGGVFS